MSKLFLIIYMFVICVICGLTIIYMLDSYKSSFEEETVLNFPRFETLPSEN